MSGNIAYAVPKNRQNVTVRLDNGASLEGEIFLEYASDDLSAHQKITAFLENSNAFFPIKTTTGSTEFINKVNVRAVEVKLAQGAEGDYFSFRPMHTIQVITSFCDGDPIIGQLMAEVPAEKTRLSDCLNLPDQFLNVKASGKMCYINKIALQKVVEKNNLE